MILTKGRSNEINYDAFIENKILSGQLDSILIVVPTNRKLRDLKKKIIDHFRLAPVSKIYIETLTTLSTKIYSKHSGFIPLSEAASSVLINESTTGLELSYFGSYTKGIPFGSLDRIKNVISEYKRHGIAPSDIILESEKLSKGEKAKAFDLAKIYEIYSQKCSELNAYEIGDIYRSIIELSEDELQKYFLSNYPEVITIVLEGFDEFTSIELRILELLSELVNNEIIINIDYFNRNKEIFSHLDDTYSRLIDIGFRRIRDKSPEEKSKFRDTIRERLFKGSHKRSNESFKKNIFKISASNRIDEIESIARVIKVKIIKNNIEPQKICVALNSIGKYSSLIRDIFGKFGIPLNLTDRIPIKSSQPVIAAISLIELVAGDFYFKDLIRVLSSKFLTFNNIDLSNIIFTANKLKIIRGIENWELSVNDAISLLQFNDDLSDEDKWLLKEKYSRAKKDVETIANIFTPFRKTNNKHDFLSKFKKLILELKLPQNMIKNAYGREEEFVKALTIFLNTLEEVLILVDSEDTSRKYSINYFLDNIKTISNWARFNVKEKSDYGVLVTSLNEIRGLKFELLFLGGMVDGDFPTKYSPEIFFPDSFQKKEYLHQTEERYHFYQSLCCWEKELYLSVPKSELGTELVESSFIKDFSNTVELTEIKDPLPQLILAKEELLSKYKIDCSPNVRYEMGIIGLDLDLIDRNINVKSRRKQDPFTNYEFSGFVGGENNHINDFLSTYCKKQFSVTQLETFAKCPFKYFSERILRLRSVEEPKEDIEPFELGNILHSILHDFYRKVSEEKIRFGPPGTAKFEHLQKILFEIAESTLNNLNLNSPLAFFEKEKILGIDGDKQNSILYKFLREESEKQSGFMPILFEQGFGLLNKDKNEEADLSLYIDDIKIVGKIDRIDVDLERKFFNVIDYKLRGKKPSLKDLKNGLSLQLPIYLKAGKMILKELRDESYDGYNMIIYSLDFREDNFGPMIIRLSRKKLEDEDIISLNKEQYIISSDKIRDYHKRIRTGKFNLSELEDREEKICKYCDFRSFCRVKEVFE